MSEAKNRPKKIGATEREARTCAREASYRLAGISTLYMIHYARNYCRLLAGRGPPEALYRRGRHSCEITFSNHTHGKRERAAH